MRISCRAAPPPPPAPPVAPITVTLPLPPPLPPTPLTGEIIWTWAPPLALVLNAYWQMMGAALASRLFGAAPGASQLAAWLCGQGPRGFRGTLYYAFVFSAGWLVLFPFIVIYLYLDLFVIGGMGLDTAQL